MIAGVTTMLVRDDLLNYNDPLSGWPVKGTLRSIGFSSAPNATVPKFLANRTITFRYAKDVNAKQI